MSAIDWLENLLLAAGVSFLVWALTTEAHSQVVPRPPVEAELWTDAAQLTLAQALVGEADFSEADHAAIAWVLARRWKSSGKLEPFEAFICRYSSVMKTNGARTKAIRSLPWGEASNHPWGGARWLRVQSFVRAWGAGRILDPCPTASHFGGPMDRPGKGWRVVGCGMTRNLFYRETR